MGHANVACQIGFGGTVRQISEVTLGRSDRDARAPLAAQLDPLAQRQGCLGAAKTLEYAGSGEVLDLNAEFGIW